MSRRARWGEYVATVASGVLSLLGLRKSGAAAQAAPSSSVPSAPLPLAEAEQLSLRLLRQVMEYEQTLFGRARRAGKDERALARARAYHLAGHDDLPETVRLPAADALAALDHGDRTAAAQAVALLSTAVRTQSHRP
ncbi:hypothetical protein OG552_18490 [Streptomyces sp. NBC_01476]|uniref:hypothetical protein n=1 Tax=Streptomyces sp. NBC_01476 TaxID=2903881 RepID=UPI002E31ED32|nr:hypothetical protein [Streptomyces sp. NBC_01476]